jgi:hypothetical protein
VGLWKGLLVPGPYVAFAWVAEWPIFALDRSKDRIAEALDHARALLGPERQPAPRDLLQAIREASRAETPEATRRQLEDVARIASRYGYLSVSGLCAAAA